MLNLISVNMEGSKHLPRVTTLIDQLKPTVICLQEAPETFLNSLTERGYKHTFSPMLRTEEIAEGLIFASSVPFVSHTKHYHQASLGDVKYDANNKPGTVSHLYIFATINHEDSTYNIATTHVMVTEAGATDDHQRAGVASMLKALTIEPPHVICGDFNIPRGYNELYPSLLTHYVDAIPTSYFSSLDPTLHRVAREKIDRPIFDTYMVDYLFTQPPYQASNVQLKFGISDHAAILADLEIKN